MDSRVSIAVGCVAVLLVLTGCLSGGIPGGGGSPTPTPGSTATATATTTTTTATASPPPTSSPLRCVNSVAFYGLGSPGETAWAPDRIAIGYTVPANASVLFVAFEEGTVLGATHVETTDLDHGVTADGDGIPLDDPLAGTHTIRIGAYADTNGNGQFDAGTDAPCRSDGAVVEAGPRRIDFDAIQYTPPGSAGTATPESPTATGSGSA